MQKVHWQAETYDEAMSFVSEYGEDIVKEWLKPVKGERIIDFGCGTGDLAARISGMGAEVVGVDISPEMVERARSKFPNITFMCADGMGWRSEQSYDAVFSNAALHWMKEPETAIQSMTSGLVPGGRLVAEFGGYGNVSAIITAVEQTLLSYEREEAFVMPWYFPKVGEYASLLEKYGMEVRIARLFDRPTILNNGEEGMRDWLSMFGTAMFPMADRLESEKWIRDASEKLKETLYDGTKWIADYRRLSIFAVKR
ncbi:methyltransferase domain-containing protein [Cohnella terricola]|uniref:Methyltransferase domain-containing protein n=2 Tax=Cohnella terricola TaxID=1289167 RepID=A0A559J9J4_9BACL|nr:methyltransferase domain-containing protein [Cohnella terricola]